MKLRLRYMYSLVLVFLFVSSSVTHCLGMYGDLTRKQIEEAIRFGVSYSDYLFILGEPALKELGEAAKGKYGTGWEWRYRLKHSWDSVYKVAEREWGPTLHFEVLSDFLETFDAQSTSSVVALEGIVVTPFLRIASHAAEETYLFESTEIREKEEENRASFTLERFLEERGDEIQKEVDEELVSGILLFYASRPYPDWVGANQYFLNLFRRIVIASEEWNTKSSLYQDYLYIILRARGGRDFPKEVKTSMRYEGNQIRPLHVT